MATPIPRNRAAMTAYEVAVAAGGAIARDVTGGAVAVGFTTDSREVTAGGAFVALHGEKIDGHNFIESALKAGARLLVVSRKFQLPERVDADVVAVDDPLEAWGAIARHHLRSWRRARHVGGASVLAITGSSGKTSTKELSKALLATVGAVSATSGNLNNRIGMPATIFTVNRAHRFAVLEAGMDLSGEMAALGRICEPDVAVITRVDLTHNEGVGGSKFAVGAEKGALLEALRPGGVAVVNADDPMAMAQLARTEARAVLFGRGEAAHYRLIERTSRGASGSWIQFSRPVLGASGKSEVVEVDLPLIGGAAAMNTVAAVAAAETVYGANLPVELIQKALYDVAPTPGRAFMRPLRDEILLIDDSYNANPASMSAAVDTLGEVATGRRKVLVLGEMRGLGTHAAVEHAELGRRVAREQPGLVIGCGGHIDRALEVIAGAGLRVISTKNSDEAAEVAVREVKSGDVVLVKASLTVNAAAVVQALREAYGTD